jgi:predicted N-acetyltransferase YhbS
VITARPLARPELERVWEIDRREVVERMYRLVDGRLVLEPCFFDVRGWPPGEAEKYGPILLDCFDRGGWLHGAFDGAALVGAAVLDAKWLGRARDQLQLAFLHVGRGHRDRGLGRRLFDAACAEAQARGAKRLYVSATPSQHTIDFYVRAGCVPTREPDPELYELEPEDIHLERAL